MQATQMTIHSAGSPGDLSPETVHLSQPGRGEVLLSQRAIGVNMIDTYVVSGAYDIDPFPLVPGVEGAGVVEAVGAGVDHLKPGDRVAYGGPPLGAFASARIMPAGQIVKLPDEISFQGAAAMMIAGLTAHMLTHLVYRVRPGTRILVHAAAGATGRSVVRWAAHLGAEVFGTVGTQAKAEIAQQEGCAHPILYRQADFAEAVMDLTAGAGVDVVIDGIGKDTFDGSFRALSATGLFVSYGQASGPCPPIDLGNLPVTFSNQIARPSVFTYNRTRAQLEASSRAVFSAVADGILMATPSHSWALEEAPEALTALSGGRTSGPIVLIP